MSNLHQCTDDELHDAATLAETKGDVRSHQAILAELKERQEDAINIQDVSDGELRSAADTANMYGATRAVDYINLELRRRQGEDIASPRVTSKPRSDMDIIRETAAKYSKAGLQQ